MKMVTMKHNGKELSLPMEQFIGLMKYIQENRDSLEQKYGKNGKGK